MEFIRKQIDTEIQRGKVKPEAIYGILRQLVDHIEPPTVVPTPAPAPTPAPTPAPAPAPTPAPTPAPVAKPSAKPAAKKVVSSTKKAPVKKTPAKKA